MTNTTMNLAALLAPQTEKRTLEWTNTDSGRSITLELHEDVGSPAEYNEEFRILREARVHDVVNISINTHGGHLDTAVHFVHLIQECKGQVIGHLNGNGYSAGSLIFLACPVRKASVLGTLMLHRESGGAVGKGSDTEKQMDFMKKYIREVYEHVYAPFLTERDFERLMDGVDLWFTPTEVRELLDSRSLPNLEN